MARRRPEWQERINQLLRTGPHPSLTREQLSDHLLGLLPAIGGPERLTTDQVIRFLSTKGSLRRVNISPAASMKDKAGNPYQKKVRYVWPDTTPLSVALSLRGNSYFTHGTAASLLGLSPELPRTIYVNREQSPKPASTIASQAAIDRAFQSQPRTSNYIYSFGETNIVLLNGKNTGMLGRIEVQYLNGEAYPVTNVERTMIDCVVRPAYAGDILRVRDIFTKAKGRVSADSLVSMLKALAYVYPYHQAIGFIMQRTGYTADQYEPLRALGMQYNFYLTHRMQNPKFDPLWRIYYPAEL